jgi:hypothetical protein
VAAAALTIGAGSILIVLLLTRRTGIRLSIYDAVTVAGVLLGAAGHCLLAGVIVSRWHGPWPLRGGDLAWILRVAAWASVLSGFAGASQALHVRPEERGVHGIEVSGVLEFFARVIFFTIPGWTLGVLSLVSVRTAREANGTRAGRAADPHADDGRETFAIQVFGRFEPGQVTTIRKDEPRGTTPEVEAAIARIWEAELSLAKEFGRPLFNGPLARVLSVQINGNTLTIECGPTCYRDFLGTNLHRARDIAAFAPQSLADAMGVSGLILTSDGFLALGRRSERVGFHAGYLHPFGGMLDERDQHGDHFDVFASITREIGEELDVVAYEISRSTVVGLVRDLSIRQPELCFEISVSLSRAALLRRFASGTQREEHVGIELVPDEPEAIVPFLTKSEPVTPVAEAALLLHGRDRWGDEWYERACFVYFGRLPPRWPAAMRDDLPSEKRSPTFPQG